MKGFLAFAVARGVMSCSELCLRDLKDKKLVSKVAVWCGEGHLLGSIVAHCAANCTKYSESVIALAARSLIQSTWCSLQHNTSGPRSMTKSFGPLH